MATFSSVSRHHVIQAIEEYDQRGGESFCAVYGFTPQSQWVIHHDGRSYDLPAVVGVAHRFATGRLATSDDIAGSLTLAASILRKRGFDVTEPGVGRTTAASATGTKRTSARATTPRTTTPRARKAPTRASEPEPVAPVCPTCFTNLPATGVCDYCS